MPSSKITRREVESVRSATKRTGRPAFLWDAELKGFGVRVAPSGKASWLVKKLLGAGGRGSKEVRFVFGDYEELPLERARDQALTLIADIRKGIDLSDRKRQERSKGLAIQQSGKLQLVFEAYIQRNAEPGRYWSEIERLFKADIIPAIGKDTLIANITKQELRSLIETKEDTAPGVARFLFAVLRPFFKWCISRDLIATSPLEGLSAPKNSVARDRILSDFEIKVFHRASTKLGWPFGPFYLLLLLTAQRREEVSGMRWSEIHIADGAWIIPKERTKNGKEHLVHLSPQAIDLITTIERQPGTDFVFTTTLETSISGYSKAKRLSDVSACGTDLAT